MKIVKFIYTLGQSIELEVTATVSYQKDTARIDEVFCLESDGPFDIDRISIQPSEFPFRSVYLDDLFRDMAIEEAKKDV